MDDAEVLVIAYGFEYALMAVNLARSIGASNPGLARAVITNDDRVRTLLEQEFERVVVRDESADRNRTIKTAAIDFAIARRNVLVDADAEVVGDLAPALRLLDRFDVLLKMNASPLNKPFDLDPDIPSTVFPQYSSGVVFFRRSAPAERFFATWAAEFAALGLDRDQPALARTVLRCPEVPILVLNAIWNANPADLRSGLFRPEREQPRIDSFMDPASAPAIAGRLARTLEEILPALPASLREESEVRRVVEKYRLLGHPAARWPMTRRILFALRSRARRLTGRGPVDIWDRGSVSIGERYSGGRGGAGGASPSSP